MRRRAGRAVAAGACVALGVEAGTKLVVRSLLFIGSSFHGQVRAVNPMRP